MTTPTRSRHTDAQLALIRHYRDRGVLGALSTAVNEMCAPLWWDEPEQVDPLKRRQSGTVCLVNTGERLIGITAYHVHCAITDRLDAGSTQWTQLGWHTFEPRDRIVDHDPELDLATYSLSEIEVNATNHRAYVARSWPPTALGPRDICIVGGYPWELSTDPSPHRREMKFLHFFAAVGGERKDWEVIRLEPEHSYAWKGEGLPSGTNLGGLSGGPVFRYTEPPAGLSTLELCAITTDWGYGQDLARPLSLVRADGTLVRSKPPTIP